jgi:hypothetical protein
VITREHCAVLGKRPSGFLLRTAAAIVQQKRGGSGMPGCVRHCHRALFGCLGRFHNSSLLWNYINEISVLNCMLWSPSGHRLCSCERLAEPSRMNLGSGNAAHVSAALEDVARLSNRRPNWRLQNDDDPDTGRIRQCFVSRCRRRGGPWPACRFTSDWCGLEVTSGASRGQPPVFVHAGYNAAF